MPMYDRCHPWCRYTYVTHVFCVGYIMCLRCDERTLVTTAYTLWRGPILFCEGCAESLRTNEGSCQPEYVGNLLSAWADLNAVLKALPQPLWEEILPECKPEWVSQSTE